MYCNINHEERAAEEIEVSDMTHNPTWTSVFTQVQRAAFAVEHKGPLKLPGSLVPKTGL